MNFERHWEPTGVTTGQLLNSRDTGHPRTVYRFWETLVSLGPWEAGTEPYTTRVGIWFITEVLDCFLQMARVNNFHEYLTIVQTPISSSFWVLQIFSSKIKARYSSSTAAKERHRMELLHRCNYILYYLVSPFQTTYLLDAYKPKLLIFTLVFSYWSLIVY